MIYCITTRKRNAAPQHVTMLYLSVVNPDFELRRGPGFNLLAQLAFLPSVISSLFTQNKGGRAGRGPRAPPLDPPLFMSSSGAQSFAIINEDVTKIESE